VRLEIILARQALLERNVIVDFSVNGEDGRLVIADQGLGTGI
jgi:hypothetical protein